MVLTLCALCAFSQNLRINFYAQIDENKKVAPDSVLVENLASGYSKMIHKELSDDKSITIIGKWLDKPNTIGDEPAEQDFLCQKTKATVAVSMNRSAKLHLALYNISGTKITDYANDFGVGQYEFSVSAPIGIYVLTANDGVRSSSLKLSIEGYDNARIEEIAVENANNSILKSYHDTVKFYNIEDLRFTGYYNGLSDVQFFDISSFLYSEEIVFDFISIPIYENASVTGNVTDITASTATLSAVIKNPQSNTIIEKGFFIGENNPIENGTKYVVDTWLFTYTLFNLTEQTTYMYCPYVVTDDGTIYGDIISFTTKKAPEPIIKDGVILAAFSVSETKKIYFSQGNLQFNAVKGTHLCADGTTKQGTWRFAEHQWNYVGTTADYDYYTVNTNGDIISVHEPGTGNVFENGERCDNNKISSTYDGWIDLFGYATSGWDGSDTEGVDRSEECYQPWSSSNKNSDYIINGETKAYIIEKYRKADWGIYNSISNGGNSPNMWRTITHEEFEYIVFGRKNAQELKGSAIVNGVLGLVLLPDNWILPKGLSFVPSNITNEKSNYSVDEWKLMEQNGAVFLPAAGIRTYSSGTIKQGSANHYWASSAIWGDIGNNTIRAWRGIPSYGYGSDFSTNRCEGLAVRLVKDVE